MKDIVDELYNEVHMLNAAIDVLNGIANSKAISNEDKNNLELKLEIIKEEAMKHNLKIRRSIHKFGY